MKNLFLILSFIFSLNVFASGNLTMQPVSTQRVANASLTCPSGKWCKVVVNALVNSGIATGTCFGGPQVSFTTFEVVLKSGDVISGSVSGAQVIQTVSSSNVSIAITINSTQVGYVQAQMSCNTASLMSTQQQYSFYSMEYFN